MAARGASDGELALQLETAKVELKKMHLDLASAKAGGNNVELLTSQLNKSRSDAETLRTDLAAREAGEPARLEKAAAAATKVATAQFKEEVEDAHAAATTATEKLEAAENLHREARDALRRRNTGMEGMAGGLLRIEAECTRSSSTCDCKATGVGSNGIP
ncbi:hypothetical protein T492DRAFT_849113 [Pavlovales sp. CCMP2436]|nr:hypothetical protein T492DRAFT_849113 [Pavlovales sp. CCMP2436]